MLCALDEEEDLVAKNMNTVDFTKLYDCLTKNDEICFSQAFLLYMLIQGNNNFSLYSFARSDCDTLVNMLVQFSFTLFLL